MRMREFTHPYQLQPHNAAWVDIPENIRQAMLVIFSPNPLLMHTSFSLQNQLSKNYQTLTVGDVITMTHNNRAYKFNVTQVRPPSPTATAMDIVPDEPNGDAPTDEGEKEKDTEMANAPSDQLMLSDSDFARQLDAELNPPKQIPEPAKPTQQRNITTHFPFDMYGISILDADVTVDVLEPLEGIVPITNISFEKSKKIEEQGKLNEGDYAYFALKVTEVPEGKFLLIKVYLSPLSRVL